MLPTLGATNLKPNVQKNNQIAKKKHFLATFLEWIM
jgi:hypothetical protein